MINRRTGYSLLAFIVVFMLIYTLFTLLYFVSDSDNAQCSDDAQVTAQIKQKPDIITRNLVLREIVSAQKKGWEITAKKTNIFQKSSTIECKNVTCRILADNQQIAILEAKKTFIDNQTKNVSLLGNVKGTMQGITIKGSDFHYCFSQDAITTDRPTIYNNPEFQMVAQKSLLDLRNKELRMSGGVTTTFLTGSSSNSSKHVSRLASN